MLTTNINLFVPLAKVLEQPLFDVFDKTFTYRGHRRIVPGGPLLYCCAESDTVNSLQLVAAEALRLGGEQ